MGTFHRYGGDGQPGCRQLLDLVQQRVMVLADNATFSPSPFPAITAPECLDGVW